MKNVVTYDVLIPEIVAMLLEELNDLLHGVALLQQVVHRLLHIVRQESTKLFECLGEFVSSTFS